MQCFALLSASEGALRSSIEAESFVDMAELLKAYVEAIERQLTVTPAEELVALQSRVSGFLEWAATMARAARGCAAAELAQLQLASSYTRLEVAPNHMDTNG